MRASAVCVVKNRQHVTPKGEWLWLSRRMDRARSVGSRQAIRVGPGLPSYCTLLEELFQHHTGDMQASRLSCRSRPRRVPHAVHALTET
jgi:hypothetical protein